MEQEGVREIGQYMEDIKTMVGQCEANVTDAILIQKAKYYCSTDIKEQFITIGQDNWGDFRKEVIAMYGGDWANHIPGAPSVS